MAGSTDLDLTVLSSVADATDEALRNVGCADGTNDTALGDSDNDFALVGVGNSAHGELTFGLVKELAPRGAPD